jgi:hypothetical protein
MACSTPDSAALHCIMIMLGYISCAGYVCGVLTSASGCCIQLSALLLLQQLAVAPACMLMSTLGPAGGD